MIVLKLIAAGVLAVILLTNNGSANPNYPMDSKDYPNPERNEEPQGTYPDSSPIIDPYRFMENSDDVKTKEFIEKEIDITNSYLQRSPDDVRKKIEIRYNELWKISKYEGPFQKGEKYFSYRNTGSEKQDVLYVQDAPLDHGKVFLNPNELKDGTVTLDKAGSAFSVDGSVFGYLTSESNSVGKSLQFKHVQRDDIYGEKLTRVASITWANENNKGVFYWHFKSEASSSDYAGTKNHQLQLRYHVLGTEQIKDIDILDFPQNTNNLVSSKISDDGKFLVVSASDGTNKNLVYYVANLDNVTKDKLNLTPLVKEMEASYDFITNEGSRFIFLTNKNSENNKLVVVDISTLSWEDFVPEENEKILDWVAVAWNKLVLCYIHNNTSVLQLHDAKSGKLATLLKLDIGTVQKDTFYSDKKHKDVYFNFVSFLIPGIIYHCDLSKSSFELENIKETSVPNFDRKDYIEQQVVIKSEDNTEIRMHIVHNQKFQKSGNNLTFMTTRGGFGVKNLPYFSVNRVAIVDNLNGVHATIYIKGERYRAADTQHYIPKSIADFLAAAEYLIKEKYTSPKLLAIDGGASGTSGPLIGASLNQRSELFGAVIAEAGLMDMLRFDESPIGRKWVSQYGSPKDKNVFKYLKEYSPLHNVNILGKEYPATMILTSKYDDRVPPLHSLKFIATLQFQAKQQSKQKNPLLLKVTKSTDISVEEAVDITLFIVMNTGVEFHLSSK